jgi:hypothetical protein
VPTDSRIALSRTWPGYQRRAFEEMKEMKVKCNRLAMTLRNTSDTVMDHEDRVLLQRQYEAMLALVFVLEARVTRFAGGTDA